MNQTSSKITTLLIGYWVALSIQLGTAPLRCYVGQIEAIDDYGVRITLIDWLTGHAQGYDFFVPWESIESALIATPTHDLSHFSDYAQHWQESLLNVKTLRNA